MIGALSTYARFTGIEQRAHFVDLARALADLYRIPRLTYICADAVEGDWSGFDAIYLYNPFQEQLYDRPIIDDSVERSSEKYSFYVKAVRERLAGAKVGARVVTYHGFGGIAPSGYDLSGRDFCGTGYLELFVKKS